MSIKPHDRRFLCFTTGSVMTFTGISALLVAVWLPSIVQPHVAKTLRIAKASTSLFGDVERQDSTELPARLSAGADPNARQEVSWGNHHSRLTSALNVAVRNGDYASVRILLDAGANPNLAIPHAPLETALQRQVEPADKQEMVKLLIEFGANVSAQQFDQILEDELEDVAATLKNQGVEYGLREMCIAGDFGSLKDHLATPLREKATDVGSYRGTSTLLGIALIRSHSEIADWLLMSGASTDVGDVHRANAFHLAAVGNCVEVLPSLVRAGCDINAGDVTGDSPLNYAIPHSEPETIAALIDVGADVLRFNESVGMYPIHQAAKRLFQAHSEGSGIEDAGRIVLKLLDAGADERQRDASGRTAMDLTGEFRAHFERLIASRRVEEQ